MKYPELIYSTSYFYYHKYIRLSAILHLYEG